MRVARFGERLDRELKAAPCGLVDALEADLCRETLKEVGVVLHEFAASIAARSRGEPRADRMLLAGTLFPPLL